MSRRRRQQILLAALLVVLAVAIWWRFGSRLVGDGGDATGRFAEVGFASRSSSVDTGTLPEVVDLRLDDLQAVSGEFEQGRDPFRLRQPEPAPPSDTRSALREAMEKARQAQEVEEAVQTAPSRPRPPAVDVVFLGSFGPASLRLAVFTDGKEIFNVGRGDVLKDKFVVVRIGFESADLGFVGFPEVPAQRLEIGG